MWPTANGTLFTKPLGSTIGFHTLNLTTGAATPSPSSPAGSAPKEVESARKLLDLLNDTLTQARALAHGLNPIDLRAGGAAPVRVPWTLTLGRYERGLLGAVQLPVLQLGRDGRAVQVFGMELHAAQDPVRIYRPRYRSCRSDLPPRQDLFRGGCPLPRFFSTGGYQA